MASNPPVVKRRMPRFLRIIRMRPRLSISTAIALVAIAALFGVYGSDRAVTNLLVGWDIGLALYIVLAFEMMRRADVSHIRSRAAMQDEGALALLLLPVAAAVASLIAIFFELAFAKNAQLKGADYGLHVSLALVTIALSWTFIHLIFALHYAHDYYGEGHRANGLEFPGKEKPDYWDFTYFSFVIGMTFQVSDVQVTNRLIRRLVVTHGALSFVFNTAILAVTVNLATNAI